MTVHFTWFYVRFRVLPADASEDTMRIYTRTYIMMLLSTQTFGEKNENRVYLRLLPYVAKLNEMAALAFLYRSMCRVANRNITNLASSFQLLQSWIFWQFSTLRPYGFETFAF
ncbi:hypothetical protein Ahy_A10g048750 [Arachis hypogaea]|uniref:Aminotransferase-like plant mobile domain-containing protein n=1 Tax=Arachis hypogaea TaxID=3818 RepID=A0A445B5S5_ARAHY|nr:hypothetical protein Ahy_A10g048750 [Arachis hypogaea]